jgi:hypothetical protein
MINHPKEGTETGGVHRRSSATEAPLTRRDFLNAASATVVGAVTSGTIAALGQEAGERPESKPGPVVMNPQGRVPVGLIIDDSTCLVNLNRFAVPQFAEAWGRGYTQNWRDWPVEIPDRFVRRFGEWCADQGVKGKYSVVPDPACIGRLDRLLPGWTQAELRASLDLVRTVLAPNWDIHPEMVTHTRVIDVRTGHPYTDHSLKFMENWDWTTGRSADEIAEYMVYALRILRDVGLPCDGITTPGGFGTQARPQLAQATQESVRDVFGAEIPHYFRDLYDEGDRSVAPRVERASGLAGTDPRCVVSIIGCTGDWTGGWDCVVPEGADRFISADLSTGRMVEVIGRGEPAFMVCHWTGIYWNGQELGFKVFQEVVGRLRARFSHLLWMKPSEVARYWAARELTRREYQGGQVVFGAPFPCPNFTVELDTKVEGPLRLKTTQGVRPLAEVADRLRLQADTWCREGSKRIVCFSLPKGESRLETGSA